MSQSDFEPPKDDAPKPTLVDGQVATFLDFGSSSHVSMATTRAFPAEQTPVAISITLPPMLLGRYEFRSILGRGGFGTVFQAWDHLLHRSVAIKIARRDRLHGTTGCQRFLDEARAAARLKHPNIVTVFDSGSDADGNPFVVFELIPGESLLHRLKRQALPQADAIDLMITVATAAHHAHKQGLVHRDLKPANILLDEANHPHITDFGLALDEQSQRELAGEVAGSPQYMSPEQMRGEVHYLDGRTDIWSMGVILYELLAKRRPFQGRDFEELRNEILHREPKPLRQIDDSIPPDLEAICHRCLKKTISERWSSAADLAAALQSLVTRSKPRPNNNGYWLTGTAFTAAAIMFASRQWPANHRSEERVPAPHRQQQPGVQGQLGLTSQPAAPAMPPKPLPGKWFPLLSRPPEFLLWPDDERNSRRDFSEVDREIWLTCRSSGLVKLGEANSDYEVQLKLHQSPWTGDVGLFLGLADAIRDNMPATQYQVIELSCPRDRRGQFVFLNRVQITRAGNTIISRSTLAGVPLPQLLNQDSTLRVMVTNGRLTLVEWNGAAQPQLVDASLESAFPPSAQQGAFGISVDQSSVVIRHAELLIRSGANP